MDTQIKNKKTLLFAVRFFIFLQVFLNTFSTLYTFIALLYFMVYRFSVFKFNKNTHFSVMN